MTNKDTHNFDESIRRHLSPFEVSPSDALWERVEQSLAHSQGPSPLISILRWGSAVAATVLLGTLGARFLIQESHLEMQQEQIASILEFQTIEAEPFTLPQVSLLEPRAYLAMSHSAEQVAQIEEDSYTQVESPAVESPLEEATPDVEEEHEVEESRQPAFRSVESSPSQYRPTAQRTRTPLSLLVAGAAGSSSVSHAVTMPNMPNEALQGPSRSPFELLSAEQVKPDKISHRAPWSFSIGAAYQFAPRWRVESGLSYTYLASDLKLHSEESVLQELQFVGLPLRANFEIVNSQYFTLYAAAGGAIERCISAKWDKLKVNENLWHYSSDLAIGAQYNINKLIGIYLEPQLQYYFGDSKLESVRTESPFNFGMRFGLRFSLH